MRKEIKIMQSAINTPLIDSPDIFEPSITALPDTHRFAFFMNAETQVIWSILLNHILNDVTFYQYIEDLVKDRVSGFTEKANILRRWFRTQQRLGNYFESSEQELLDTDGDNLLKFARFKQLYALLYTLVTYNNKKVN